jgi:hypothetical protein
MFKLENGYLITMKCDRIDVFDMQSDLVCVLRKSDMMKCRCFLLWCKADI